MPKIVSRTFISLLFLGLSHTALPETPAAKDLFQEKEDAIVAEMDREVASGSLKADGPVRGLRDQLQFIVRIRDEHPNDPGITVHLRGLRDHAAAISPGLAKACADLFETVEKANLARASQRSEATRALLQQTAEAIRSAKKAADLASAVSKLQEGTASLGNQPMYDQENWQRLTGAQNALRSWQSDLASFEEGNLAYAMDRARAVTVEAAPNFGPLLPPTFFEDSANGWVAYWRQKVDEVLANAKRDLPMAQSAADALRVNDAIQTLQRTPFGSALPPETARRLAEVNSVSHDWSEVLQDEAVGSYHNALNKLNGMKVGLKPETSPLTSDDLTKRKDAIYTMVAEKARATLDQAGKQLAATMAPEQIEGMENSLTPLQETLGTRAGDFADILARITKFRQVAQAWRLVVIAQNQKDAEAMLRFLNEFTRIDSGPNAVVPASVVEEKRRFAASVTKEAETVSPADDAWLVALPNRISSLAKSSDVAALASEIRERMKLLAGKQNSLRDDLNQLLTDLNSLTQFAASCEQARFTFAANYYGEKPRHRWQKQTSEVRVKLARQSLATQLAAPELPQGILDFEGLEKAVQQLAGDAARKKDWPRVYKILSVCPGDRFGSGRGSLDEELRGIADYFTAQRMEKAQQWVEAIRCYQNVLRRMGDRLPIAEATERLQVLSREHPDAMAQEAASRPSPRP